MDWDGECKIIYGRPRHPQSQGLVEQANGTIERMLMALMAQHKTKEWTKFLPLVMYNLNTSRSSSTKFMPYEVTFNLKPNTGSEKRFVEINDKLEETLVSEVAEGGLFDLESAAKGELTVIDETDEDADEDDDESVESEASLSTFRQLLANRQEEANKKRNELNNNKIKNAEFLIKKHDHKRNKVTRSFELGDKVSVKIPRIDRGSADFTRLPGIVGKVSCHNQTFYSIITVFGTLNDSYRACELEPYSGIISVVHEDLDIKKISLHEAANLQAARTGSLEEINAVCNCTNKCYNDKRCSCFKIGKKCTSHCHIKKVRGNATPSKIVCCNK